MSGKESNTDEDACIHAGPAQAAQQDPVWPVLTLEKNTSSAVAVRGWLVKVEELTVTIFGLF